MERNEQCTLIKPAVSQVINGFGSHMRLAKHGMFLVT